MSAPDERNVDPMQVRTRVAQDSLRLARRGFRESFRSSRSHELIYDSEWCRLSLVWRGWDPMGGNSMSIYYGRRQPDWLAQIHSVLRQHYGERLFEPFDLRRPDLWEQYRQFLRQVYDIQGRSPAIRPSLDKVC